MKRRKRVSGWLRRVRRRRAARKQQAPLREFVYLDEVSVYSLIASRLGPIAVEFTDTETTSLQSELSGNLSAGVGVLKSEVSSQLQSNQTRGSQVLRKSIVQTAFRDLYELEKDRLVLRPPRHGETVPALANSEQFRNWLTVPDRPWAIRSEELRRGELVELEVELETEAIFRLSTAVSAFLEIIRESPEVAELAKFEQAAQAQSIGRVLEKLLAGLIPLRAVLSDYKVVIVDGREHLVHLDVLRHIQLTQDITVYSVNLVGVAEETLFWKDVRRVLFSHSRYRVLCRIARSGTQRSWTPVKLADVFTELSPEIAAGLEDFNRTAAVLPSRNATTTTQDEYIKALHVALTNYAQTIARKSGHAIGDNELANELLIPSITGSTSDSAEERREPFRTITRRMQEKYGLSIEPFEGVQLRTDSLRNAGIGIDGNVMPVSAQPSAPHPQQKQELFLDAEIIAIYW